MNVTVISLNSLRDEGKMKCPNCGLINPDSAVACDCGYDFQSRTMMNQGKLSNPSRQKRVWGIIVIIFVLVALVIAGIEGILLKNRAKLHNVVATKPELPAIKNGAAVVTNYKRSLEGFIQIPGDTLFVKASKNSKVMKITIDKLALISIHWLVTEEIHSTSITGVYDAFRNDLTLKPKKFEFIFQDSTKFVADTATINPDKLFFNTTINSVDVTLELPIQAFRETLKNKEDISRWSFEEPIPVKKEGWKIAFDRIEFKTMKQNAK